MGDRSRVVCVTDLPFRSTRQTCPSDWAMKYSGAGRTESPGVGVGCGSAVGAAAVRVGAAVGTLSPDAPGVSMPISIGPQAARSRPITAITVVVFSCVFIIQATLPSSKCPQITRPASQAYGSGVAVL